ncbi:small heat shock protein [Auriculariales sp. MPI-PUGE-AT-0066]|nr:small heat shock protein [Auriculariales sp. MPI-PUGE-AT-0066]
MSLIWTPRDLERFFDDSFNGPHSGQRLLHRDDTPTTLFKPRMDLHENAENNLMTATFELPGLKKEDVTIDVHNGRLTVSGETKTSSETSQDGYVVRERRAGRFSRILQLPNGVSSEKISAALNDGVLTVTWPKSTPEQDAKRVTIN